MDRRKGRNRKNEERDSTIVARLLAGRKHHEVGAEFGVTGERIRQVLVEHEERTGETLPRYVWRQPKRVKAPRPLPVQRFLDRAVLVHDTGCWHWTGPLFDNKRPVSTIAKDLCGEVYAVRASYRLWIGPIPPKHFVRQSCSDSLCINPCHLEAVSIKQRFRESPLWDSERGTWKHTPCAIQPRQRLAVGGYCRNGHHIVTPQGIITQKSGAVCRQCKNDNRKRHYRANREKGVSSYDA